MTSPPLMIPVKLSAPPISFFHFLLGYFLPVAAWLNSTSDTDVRVQDVGPLAAWFELLGGNVEVDRPTQASASWSSRRRNEWGDSIKLRAWDARHAYRTSKLSSATAHVKELTLLQPSQGPHPITVVSRGQPHPWYTKQGLDSANERRSLPNIDKVVQVLESFGDVELIDPARLTPAEQVRLFSNRNVLVAQHGAALANMVWMKAGGTVVEIFPPARRIWGWPPTLFADLAQCLGHSYVLVPQTGIHDPVDPASVHAALSRAPTPRRESRLKEVSRVVRGHALRYMLAGQQAIRTTGINA